MASTVTCSAEDSVSLGQDIGAIVMELFAQQALLGMQVETHADGTGALLLHFSNGLVKRQTLPETVLSACQQYFLDNTALLDTLGLGIHGILDADHVLFAVLVGGRASFEDLEAKVIKDVQGVVHSGLMCWHSNGVRLTVHPSKDFAYAELLGESYDFILRLDVEAAKEFIENCALSSSYQSTTVTSSSGSVQAFITNQ